MRITFTTVNEMCWAEQIKYYLLIKINFTVKSNLWLY